MDHKNHAMKSALRSLMSEMGGMSMDRVRKMKMGPPKMDTEEGGEQQSKRKRKPMQHVHMGDPDMDEE